MIVNDRRVRTNISGCLGFGGLAFATSFMPALLCAASCGAAVGGVSSTGNALFVRLYAADAPARLNRLNFYYAPGAIFGPFVLKFAGGNIQSVFLLLALGFFMLAPMLNQLSSQPSAGAKESPSGTFWAAIALAMVTMFCYVGAEVGFSSFISLQLYEQAHLAPLTANFGVSAFWLGIAVSRFFAPNLLKSDMTERQLVILCAAVFAVSAMLILLVPTSGDLGLVAAFAAGCGAGPIFPGLIALATSRIKEQSLATGALVAIGGLGAGILPRIQAGMAQSSASGAIVVPFAAAFAVVVLTALSKKESVAKTA